MKSITHLTRTVKQGLSILKADSKVTQGLVYASENRRTVGRLVYTSHIPCNGLEELKSDEDLGVCVEVWFRKGGKQLVGMGHESSELSPDAVRQALKKAKRDAVPDPDFHGLYQPEKGYAQGRRRLSFHDRRLFSLSDRAEAKFLSRAAWETIRGTVHGIAPYARKHRLSPKQLAFILNGDHFIVRESMALASTNGVVDSECSTIVLSFLTAMLEKERSKGSAWSARSSLSGFSPYVLGKQAARSAIQGVGGLRVGGGTYPVVFGPQAVAELFGGLLLSHFTLSLIDFGASLFAGQYGKPVASPLLSLSDDPTIRGGAGSKRVSCEGAPTARKVLLDKGVLTGYLSDSRTTNKMLGRVTEATAKLGVSPTTIARAIRPSNGFRFSDGGGRAASSPVGTHATNLVIDSPTPLSMERLLRKVQNGLYIGRLWYTYPVGGYATGIISGTAVADSYLIRNGKLASPILPNTLRLEDNLARMVRDIFGVGKAKVPTILWASDEITYAPCVAVDGVRFVSIGQE